MGDLEKRSELSQRNTSISVKSKRNSRKTSRKSDNPNVDGNLKQPTIIDMFRKSGAITSQEMLNEGSSSTASKEGSTSEATEKHAAELDALPTVDISTVASVVEAQRHKFRPLLVSCFIILASTKVQKLPNINIATFIMDDNWCIYAIKVILEIQSFDSFIRT